MLTTENARLEIRCDGVIVALLNCWLVLLPFVEFLNEVSIGFQSCHAWYSTLLKRCRCAVLYECAQAANDLIQDKGESLSLWVHTNQLAGGYSSISVQINQRAPVVRLGQIGAAVRGGNEDN